MPKENKLQGRGIYQLTEQAESDLRGIWIFISEYDEAAADRVIEAFFEKFELLADNKLIGRRQDDFIVDMRMFPFKKYHIYYFPTDEGVEIYHVLHGRRDQEGEFENMFEGLKK